jgi:hypothetical protein
MVIGELELEKEGKRSRSQEEGMRHSDKVDTGERKDREKSVKTLSFLETSGRLEEDLSKIGSSGEMCESWRLLLTVGGPITSKPRRGLKP